MDAFTHTEGVYRTQVLYNEWETWMTFGTETVFTTLCSKHDCFLLQNKAQLTSLPSKYSEVQEMQAEFSANSYLYIMLAFKEFSHRFTSISASLINMASRN